MESCRHHFVSNSFLERIGLPKKKIICRKAFSKPLEMTPKMNRFQQQRPFLFLFFGYTNFENFNDVPICSRISTQYERFPKIEINSE